MANERLFSISGLILTVLCLQVLGIAGLEFAFNCSVYTFHMKSSFTWEQSKILCEQNGSKLVSMESLRAELNFLNAQSEALPMDTTEYHIGLRNNGQKWIWVSDNSTLNETKTGKFPWSAGQPSENGNCVKMWLNRLTHQYEFDDVGCRVPYSNTGYICERTSTPLKCGSNEPTSKTPQLRESTAPSAIDRSSVAAATVQRSIASSQSQSTTKDYADYKPHTIKGSTRMATKRNKIYTLSSTSYVDNRRYGSDTNSVSWVMVIFIGGGVVLVIAFGTIAILVIKLRRVTQNRDGSRDTRSEIAERIQLENQSSSLNPAQDTVATRLSGMSDENGDHGRLEVQTRQQPRTTDCGYTMLSQSAMTRSERVYASLDSL